MVMQSFERKIDELIKLCEQLDKENRVLKSEALSWQKERDSLLEKTDTAKIKVEAMLTKLHQLEQQVEA
jgi:cell division protein ZapB